MPLLRRSHRSRKKECDEILEKAKGLEESLEALHAKGSYLWKVRSPQKWYRRRFLLDLKEMKLKYDPTHKIACFADHESSHLDVADIWDVRKGWKTDTFNRVGTEEERRSKSNNSQPSVEENNCFSIIHGTKKVSLDLVAPTSDIADKWVRCIEYLVNWHASKKQEKSYENWLRKKFLAADLDGNKCLSFPETMKLVEELNIQLRANQAKMLFDEANTKRASTLGHEEVLDEDEFIAFYFKLLRRPEIEQIFDTYSSTQGILKAHELCAFLHKEQSEYASASIEDCEDLINTYEQSDMKKNKQMSCAGFLNMLLSQKFDIFEESHKGLYQDMDQPLSHYYIASSHNTYLMGNQLSGQSSLEGYADAISRGCRCVELDLWDGDDGEPLITHGFTLTTKIPLKEVLEDIIKPYAFAASKYPLILSLENHCTAPYQKRAASLLEEYLGDVLYKEEIEDSLELLPSPNQLKGKILVKGKKPAPKSAVTNRSPSPVTKINQPKSAFYIETPTSSQRDLPGSYEEAIKGGLTAEMKITSSSRKANGSNNLEEINIVSTDETKVDGAIAITSGMVNPQITDDLSSLVNLIQAVRFNSFQDSKANQKYYQMSSFSEAKALKLIESEGADFVEYNKRQLSRIYPAGSRTGSSNFDPIQFWNAGCQIVALNYQTQDIPNYLNFARFVENGGCGYVLKPKFLRNPKGKFDPTKPLDNDAGVRLRMRIISGQHLPKAPGNPEIVDPYVEIRVLGLPQDKAAFETKHIQNNGFNPQWNEMFETQIRCPELAIIYLRVKDYAYTGANMPLAHYAIPLMSICPGYRHIQLHDLRGQPLAPSTLFTHVSITQTSHI